MRKQLQWFWFLVWVSAGYGASIQFRAHVIADDLPQGYQVLPLDVDADGRLDLVALATGEPRVYWFHNPGWRRYVLVEDVPNPVNVTSCSQDAAGRPEIVLAYHFSNQPERSAGLVALVRSSADPYQPWQKQVMDQLPTSHRLRCADFDGSGQRVVVNAPLAATTARAPDYRGHVPLVFYRPGQWQRELIGEDAQGVVHGIHVVDWDADGRDEILVASFLGIHCYDYLPGKGWRWIPIAGGNPEPWPCSGASEVTVGKLGERRFLATIEPWHGHLLASYVLGGNGWERVVIEDSFDNGHTVLAVDLDGDGRDELVAGYRGEGHSVYIYYAVDDSAARWQRQLLDSQMAASSCAALDVNEDGRLDLACIGGSTANLKWYENLGQEPRMARLPANATYNRTYNR